MIARDPVSGYVIASSRMSAEGDGDRRVMDCGDASSHCDDNAGGGPPEDGHLLFTFEPDLSLSTGNNVFVGWYTGDLFLGIDPLRTFQNLLLRRVDGAEENSHERVLVIAHRDIIKKRLSFDKLMEVTNYVFENSAAISLSVMISLELWLVLGVVCWEPW